MSDEWRFNFWKFAEDIGERTTPEHSIDRINNDGDYCKENCRWATKQEQADNKGVYKTNSSGISGVQWRKDRKVWRAIVGKKHLGHFRTLGEATNVVNAYKASRQCSRKNY
jgi:hypothetical protein